MQGIIIKSTGSWYQVRAADQSVWQCRVKGKFRLDNLKLTNPVAVGDSVTIAPEAEQDHKGIITAIAPRTNYVARQSPSRKHSLHLLACNIDQAVVIVTIREPNVKLGFIDRFLLTTEPQDIPTIIVFNKMDIYDDDDIDTLAAVQEIYENIGYTTLCTSAANGFGLSRFVELLKDKTTLLSGHSGVGKSTLVNAIQPQLDIRTMDISDYSGKGQHTTTFAEMHPLSFGGNIIDTPGIKELAFIDLSEERVAHNFREIFALSRQCKYQDCKHINEPFCAVKAAVDTGEVSETRYQSYLHILGEVRELNNWELHGGA